MHKYIYIIYLIILNTLYILHKYIYIYTYLYISILLLLYPLTRWFDEPEGTRVAHEARAAGSSNEKMLLQKHPGSICLTRVFCPEHPYFEWGMHLHAWSIFQQAVFLLTECTFKTAWLSCPTSEAFAVVIPKTLKPIVRHHPC